MAHDPIQLNFTSLGLSEAEVAAWVECELPRDRHEAVGIAINSDPVLSRTLRAMRADREAVRALPEVHAPDGLLEMVEATMERQALLGLTDGVELNNAPPISVLSTARRPLSEVFARRSVPIRFAAAAVVLLTVGSAAYVGIWKLSQPTLDQGPVAIASPGDSTIDDAPGGDVVAATENTMNAQPPYSVEMHLALAQSTMPEQVDEPTGIGTLQALELAAQGRLVIHVTSSNANAALRDLGALTVRSGPTTDRWRLNSNSSETLAAMLSTGETNLASFSMADDREFEPPTLDIDRPTLTGVYIADAMLTPESMESLLEKLADDGRVATFTELEEPIDLGERPVLLEEIVWWTSSPTDWAMWTRVPVVYEPQR